MSPVSQRRAATDSRAGSGCLNCVEEVWGQSKNSYAVFTVTRQLTAKERRFLLSELMGLLCLFERLLLPDLIIFIPTRLSIALVATRKVTMLHIACIGLITPTTPLH